MHTFRSSLVGMLASIVLVALGVGGPGAGALDDEVESVSILFVGNSLTYGNGGVETHVAGLAASGSEPMAVEVDESTSGGATLLTHRYVGVADTIREGGYDVVVLQGDVPANLGRTELFLENAGRLNQAIVESGARTVFFMTWPYEEVDWVGLDDIVAAHRQVEDELDASVAPAGLAMELAQAERPDLALVVDGRGHTSPAGTYLAAATIYATVFDRDPEGLPYRMGTVTDEEAAFLQRIAWQAVGEWRAGASPDD